MVTIFSRVEITIETKDWPVLILLDRRLIFRLLIYSRSRASSSRSSQALHLMVSMPRRLSIIWLFSIADCCIVSSLIRLYGCLKMMTRSRLSAVLNRVSENSEEFIRNSTMPTPTAITTSITMVIAMLVRTDLMVLASE